MLLQTDFPEVTISKIRFLESQGLINPERTPSGYRRFYEQDFERLRWILSQQRDNYLPLKVIRERLLSGGPLDVPLPQESIETVDGTPVETTVPSETTALAAFLSTPLVDLTDNASKPEAEADRARSREVASLWDELASDVAAALIDQPSTVATEPVPTVVIDAVVIDAVVDDAVVDAQMLSDAEQEAVVAEPSVVPGTTVVPEGTVEPLPTDPVTLEELAAYSGCELSFLHELERFRLIAGHKVAGAVLFDPQSIVIAGLASRFAEHGLDPRHLRTFRLAAEREVGLISQVIEPGLRRRDPAARRAVFGQLESLVADARALHVAIVDQVMEEQFPDRLV